MELASTTKTAIFKNIPQLRFPEFDDEWIKIKLGKITKKVGSGSTPKGGREVYTDKGIPFIRSQNVNENRLILDKTHIPESIHNKMKGSVVFKDDILLNITGASIGRSCVVPKSFKEGNVNQHVSIIRLEKDDPYFLHFFLTSFNGQKRIFQSMTGSGREGINFENIRALKIFIPTTKEQQKIANFLIQVDQKIELLDKQQAALEQYKNGVMQKIFNQEIRFKIVNEAGELVEPPEWEEKRLEEFLKIPTKKTPKNIETKKILTVKLHLNGIHLNERTDSLSIGSTKYIVRRENQFIYGKQNLFNGALGIVPKKYDGYVSSGDVPALDVDTKIVKINFLFYYFSRKSYYKRLENIASGSGSKRIHEETLLREKISIPSMKEQTKIANFLTAIDTKIEAITKRSRSHREWKKGLLQKMFV